MAKRTCSLDGCAKDHLARGWCAMHYWRVRTHGDPGSAQPTRDYGRTRCDVDGCKRPHASKGMCQRHKAQSRRFGITAADISAMDDLCPICADPATHIDHCHGCGQIRGRICHGCNAGNGITDDPDLLERKAKWLRNACSCHT